MTIQTLLNYNLHHSFRLIEIHIETTTQEITFGSSTDIKGKTAGPLSVS